MLHLSLAFLLIPLADDNSGVGPAGEVYAVDISPGFVEAIERRAADYHVDNVEAIVSDPPASDLCDTYHHVEYRHRGACA